MATFCPIWINNDSDSDLCLVRESDPSFYPSYFI